MVADEALEAPLLVMGRKIDGTGAVSTAAAADTGPWAWISSVTATMTAARLVRDLRLMMSLALKEGIVRVPVIYIIKSSRQYIDRGSLPSFLFPLVMIWVESVGGAAE